MPLRIPLRCGLLLVVLLLGSVACGPRYARVKVHEDPELVVTLRAQKSAGGRLDRGFAHPATISSVRIANILSRIDVRRVVKDGAGEREPAVPTEAIHTIADGVSKALNRANAAQEVVVQSIQTRRRLGIFSDKKLTGLVLWMQDDQLVVSVTHVDYAIGRGPNDKLPEPFANRPATRIKVVPGPSMQVAATNAVAVDWRAPGFRRASNLRLGADGRVRRRTILLEEPALDTPGATPAVEMPADLSPETLRGLADLEEERRAGAISESEYNRRRRELLQGVSAPRP